MPTVPSLPLHRCLLFGVTNMTSQKRTGGWNRKSPPNFNSQSSWAEGHFESLTSVFWRSKIILLDLCVHPDPSFIPNLFVILLDLHIKRPVMSLRCKSDGRRHCRTMCCYTTNLTVNAEKVNYCPLVFIFLQICVCLVLKRCFIAPSCCPTRQERQFSPSRAAHLPW